MSGVLSYGLLRYWSEQLYPTGGLDPTAGTFSSLSPQCFSSFLCSQSSHWSSGLIYSGFTCKQKQDINLFLWMLCSSDSNAMLSSHQISNVFQFDYLCSNKWRWQDSCGRFVFHKLNSEPKQKKASEGRFPLTGCVSFWGTDRFCHVRVGRR